MRVASVILGIAFLGYIGLEADTLSKVAAVAILIWALILDVSELADKLIESQSSAS